MVRRPRITACLALVLSGVAPGWATGQDLRNGRLTMEVEAAPLQEVLQAIADEAGIELAVEGDLGEAEPQRIDAVPLDLAIRRLVGAHSLVMLHDRSTSRRLSEVRVYAVDADPETRRAESAERARQAARVERRRGGSQQEGSGGERAVRVEEVRNLARSEDGDAVDQLGRIVTSDPDPAIRRLALGALAGRGDPTAIEPMVNALDDGDRAVRVQAVRALHSLLGDDVAPYLAQVVERDEEPAVRMMAVQLAADLPGGAAETVLEQALSDPDEEVRRMAEAALEP